MYMNKVRSLRDASFSSVALSDGSCTDLFYAEALRNPSPGI